MGHHPGRLAVFSRLGTKSQTSGKCEWTRVVTLGAGHQEKRRSADQESRTADHALPALVVKQGRQGRVNGTSDCGPKLDNKKSGATLF
ncbi:hypothetical protein [Marinococcus luteus]|uniref:hypothetical protein n=1 Tax=Marinococcus luteus TaxID=1122204 RepID=UPI00115F7FFA|nr:hypothetical protein [Marinococcus luteus]